ncbi:MAG TPA: hypothetical protein VE954_24375 [Oligoflexus sp.]|uniref:hypothetical protein n=1 Tax=Oligoflexus sp. TaxID=1971216 RepID=UPI002D479048|nr:hypothetical protein [Oligoflexus sp.]HYX36252.1 hypothetical protein [Oligoflexus sp.]
MKAFVNKHFLLLVILFGGLFLVFNPFRKKKMEQPAARSMSSQAVERVQTESKAPAVTSPKASLPELRNQARDRMALGGSTFKPTVTSKGMQLSFEIIPVGRACQNGDIDLIRSVTGDQGNLLLTVEDSQQKILVEKTIRIAQLKSKLIVPMIIPARDSLQLYRLSLCSENRRSSCSKLNPIDFKKLENATIKNPGDKSFTADYLFYTYSFAAFEGGLHLFDGTIERPASQYRKYLTSHGGGESQFDFLSRTLAEEKKLGVVPIQIKDNRLTLPLYYNDTSTCEISISRRAQ